MAEAFTKVAGEAAKDITTPALGLRVAVNGGQFLVQIVTNNVQVARELGDAAIKFGRTAITLGALYTGYSLVRPLVQTAVETAIEKGFGRLLNEGIGEPKTESLADHNSEIVQQRLEEELAKVGLRVEGLKLKIEDLDEKMEPSKKGYSGNDVKREHHWEVFI